MTNHRPKRSKIEPDRCERPNGLSKSIYRSPAKARQSAEIRKGRAGVPIYTYKCPRCHGWHITSKKQP